MEETNHAGVVVSVYEIYRILARKEVMTVTDYNSIITVCFSCKNTYLWYNAAHEEDRSSPACLSSLGAG